jgi:autotransporter family porin
MRSFRSMHRAVVASVAMIGMAACGGGSSTSSTTTGGSGGTGGGTTPTGATSVYVIQDAGAAGSSTGMILQFSATGTGNITTTGTITAPANTFFGAVTTDGAGNVYAGYQGLASPGAFLEYAAGATGSPTPLRTLPSDTTTKLALVNAAATNAAGESFFAEDSGGVAVFSANATGSVPPSRYILGASQTGGGLSTLIVAGAIAADSSDNIYVVNEGAPGLMPIVVFGPTATGNVAPVRTIGGPLTLLSVGLVGGVATDSAGNLYVTTNTITGSGANAVYSGSILVFAPAASGNVAPTRSISGALTLLVRASGIQVDSVGNIFVTSTSSTGTNPAVLKFSATASGNVAPTSSFTSTAWTNPDPGVSLAVH